MATLSMTKRRLRRLLVLGLVLLPGAVLSVVTWRLIGQERELEQSRRAERRALVAARLAQQMASRLDLERAAARASPRRSAFMPDSGVLVLVAPVTDRGMLLPWEQPQTPAVAGDGEALAGGRGDQASRVATTDDPLYRRHIADGERFEFARDRPDLAADHYASAAEAASTAAARMDARLRQARALARAGRADSASVVYAAVALSSPDVRDGDGMPLALYGAEGLLRRTSTDVEPVVTVLENVVGEADLGPPALYAVRDITQDVAALLASARTGDDPESPAESAGRARQDGTATLTGRIDAVAGLAAERIRVAERMVELRRDLPAVLSLAGAIDADSARSLPSTANAGAAFDSARVTSPPSAWRPWGAEPWLVGVAGDGDGRFVLVADPVRLLRAIAGESSDDPGLVLSGVSLSAVPGPDAELLGPGFPALFAILPDAALRYSGGIGFGRALLVLVLPLVLAVTALAAFLLWRDVRREIETAGMRAQFVSSVSHELKTPLTSIRMYAQTLLLGRYRAEADRRAYLETIVNESERLTRLINNVLDFSRIERGGRRYRMKPTSLASVVDDAARAMSYPLEQGRFELHARVENGLPDVPCDGDAMTQAVVNLLSNAVKFSGDAKAIELELVREDQDAAIRVRDHGLGIDARHRAAVFERFFRTPEAESMGLPGTGLGLALVAHVAQAHGGTVELDSAPGRGSTFTLRIPMGSRASASGAQTDDAMATGPGVDGSTSVPSPATAEPSAGTDGARRMTNPEHVTP